jgi:hypothetical protein
LNVFFSCSSSTAVFKQTTNNEKKIKLAIQRSKKRIIETQSWVFEAHPLPLKTETA